MKTSSDYPGEVMLPPSSFVRSFARACVLGVFALCSGCGETKYDVYMKGATIEGEAERTVCRLHYTEQSQAAPLSGNQVLACLRETDRALEHYERAAAMGFDDHDFKGIHARAIERKERLESMLAMVREMEREQLIGRPMPE
jgi:hypothetical protein